MRLFVLTFLLFCSSSCLADEPSVVTRPDSHIAIFFGKGRLVISCPSGTPLELVYKIKNHFPKPNEDPVYIDVTPELAFETPKINERMILLELSETQCRICMPSNFDLEQVSELTRALEAYGYASDFRLVHYDRLVKLETDTNNPMNSMWKWISPNAQPKAQ